MWLALMVCTISEYRRRVQNTEGGSEDEKEKRARNASGRSVLSDLQKSVLVAVKPPAHQSNAQQAGSQQHERQRLR
jgi:hypothetical protein